MTTRLGVIGRPIGHSLSPAMHGAAIAALGIDASYVAIDVGAEELEGWLARCELRGFNVTLPHKERIARLVDDVEDEARAIGAVNTVVRDGSRWIGTNTDAEGLVRSLREERVAIEGARIVIVGAGGAARAAAYGLGRAGASIVVAARRVEQADAIARDAKGWNVDVRAAALEGEAFSGANVVVQATSVTLDRDAGAALASALPWDRIADGATVVDLVYRPRVTAVLAEASARGFRTVDGIGMLVHQGALAFERWLGVAPSAAVMRAAIVG